MTALWADLLPMEPRDVCLPQSGGDRELSHIRAVRRQVIQQAGKLLPSQRPNTALTVPVHPDLWGTIYPFPLVSGFAQASADQGDV